MIIVRKDKGLIIGFYIFISIVIIAFVISFFAPTDPRRWNTAPVDQPPSLRHILGTTSLGQDVFWLLSWSIRNSIAMGLIGSVTGLLIGLVLGGIAAHKGGITDRIIVAIADAMISIPTIMPLILLGSILGGKLNLPLLGVAFGLLTLGHPTKNIRSIILSLREREFTYIDLFSGFNIFEITFRHYMRYVFPWMSGAIVGRTLWAIGTEVTISVFGIINPDEASLGLMLHWALRYQALLRGLYWWVLPPIVILILLLSSLYILSAGLSKYLDPRVRIQKILGG